MQGPGVAQIGGVEALAELIVNGSQNPARLLEPILPKPQTSEAHGATQLQEQGSLALRQIERLPEAGLRFYLIVLGLQQEFAFDTKKFGQIPPCLSAPASFECLPDCGEGVGKLSLPAKSLGECT